MGCQLSESPPAPHWLHLFAMCFCLAIVAMLVGTYIAPLRRCFFQSSKPEPFMKKAGGNVVDITPWTPLYPYCCVVTLPVALISVALQVGSQALFGAFWVCWMVTLLALLFLLPASAPAEEQSQTKAIENAKCQDAEAGEAIGGASAEDGRLPRLLGHIVHESAPAQRSRRATLRLWLMRKCGSMSSNVGFDVHVGLLRIVLSCFVLVRPRNRSEGGRSPPTCVQKFAHWNHNTIPLEQTDQ